MAASVGEVGSPITFPSGLALPNRLIKAAMAEHLAVKGQPDAEMVKLYTEWGKGGWGAVMTGNVMIDQKYLGDAGDTSIANASLDQSGAKVWREIATAIKANGSAALMQINHPGRQSPVGAGSRGFLAKNLAPSAIPLNFGSDWFTKTIVKALFGTPAEMSGDQIQQVIASFVNAAKVAQGAGFDGVEIHAAHGYLLSTFLAPKANQRNDSWGGTPVKRASIIVEIVRETRKVVGKSFCIGVKLNSSDQQNGADFEDVLAQIAALAAEEIDFLEISGGSYEDPRMVNGNSNEPAKSAKTAQREAYFLDFASEVRNRHPNTQLMLTGGFRTRSGMNAALEARACDFIGIGRPAAVTPDFPRTILGIDSAQPVKDAEAGLQLSRVTEPWISKYIPSVQLRRALWGGAETQHYCNQLKVIASA